MNYLSYTLNSNQPDLLQFQFPLFSDFATDLWGEWHSGLKRCNWNRKIPGSNPTRHSAKLRDPTSLWGSRWPSGQNSRKLSDEHRVSDAAPSRTAHSWPWDSQVAVKKSCKVGLKNGTNEKTIKMILHESLGTNASESGNLGITLPNFGLT